MKYIKVIVSLFLILSVFTLTTYSLSQFGSKSSEVVEIQKRLKQWGYYSGEIDGIFGTATKKAVISFQKKGSRCTGPLKDYIHVFQLLCNLKNNNLYRCNGGGMLPQNI